MRSFFFLVLLLSLNANATVTVSSITGVSKYTVDANGVYSIFGGLVGTCTPSTVYDSCNSCTGTRTACNTASVFTDTVVRFNLVTNTSGADVTKLKAKIGSNVLTLTGTSTALDGNGGFFIDVTWGSLCDGAGNANCLTNGSSKTIGLGFDTNSDDTLDEKVDVTMYTRSIAAGLEDTQTFCPNGSPAPTAYQGVCGFTLKAGDEKVYIDTTSNDPSTYPSSESSTSAVKFTDIIMFYAVNTTGNPADDTTTLDSIMNNSSYATVTMGKQSDESYAPNDTRITGLVNDTRYCFVVANRDQAGNIYYFNNLSGGACETPSNVIGLLENKGCFIATAAFGSSLSPEVDVFRSFRDQYLLTNKIGVWFVKFYYKYSPPVAEFISHSEMLRSAARLFLWPLLIMSKVMMFLDLSWSEYLLICTAIFLLLVRSLSIKSSSINSFLTNPRLIDLRLIKLSLIKSHLIKSYINKWSDIFNK